MPADPRGQLGCAVCDFGIFYSVLPLLLGRLHLVVNLSFRERHPGCLTAAAEQNPLGLSLCQQTTTYRYLRGHAIHKLYCARGAQEVSSRVDIPSQRMSVCNQRIFVLW